ncbi:hypothetical protein IMCC3317_13510 [Kordia antarctica]|uniref:Secretion system C-terminal sorting domain-containing protein n=1 Tax=Kordia antarctica TaxID=1218801 RepID=A0A7L4ZGX4_9FLAO|nr:T9SS type A sorting domain-containing protein [Kordia antarctica]QHI35998.1 hypothetical protein IMCC3317_13510 [Kordia antarctica]
MKKNYTTILIFLVSFSIHAQDDPDLLGQWFLHYIESNGTTTHIPDPAVITINFTNSGNYNSTSGNSSCNTHWSDYVISNSNASIDIINHVRTQILCDTDFFEPIYLGIFGTDTTNFFDYTISTDNQSLTMTDLLGERLIYGRQVLSTEDNEVLSNTLKLYPNPTKEELYISGISTNLKTTYTIYNLVGNIIISDNLLKQDRIDMTSLKAGIYFLKITQKDKTYMKKFIKI